MLGPRKGELTGRADETQTSRSSGGWGRLKGVLGERRPARYPPSEWGAPTPDTHRARLPPERAVGLTNLPRPKTPPGRLFPTYPLAQRTPQQESEPRCGRSFHAG